MSESLQPYAVYAIKYAHHDRSSRENFLTCDLHDAAMPMDYFVWAIVGNGRTVVVDTGFSEQQARARGRHWLRSPAAGLGLLGIDCARIDDVVLTHLHYDHCGTTAEFPAAQFYLQDREMAFATGRQMTHGTLRSAFDVDSVVDIVRAVYQERVTFVDGEHCLHPGISLHHVGGHTDGLQIVRVWTQRGWLVLASDATHYYANMDRPNPFPIVFNVGDMLQGYRTLRSLSDGPDNIIPGHDPLVLHRYRAPSKELIGIVARVDMAPVVD